MDSCNKARGHEWAIIHSAEAGNPAKLVLRVFCRFCLATKEVVFKP